MQREICARIAATLAAAPIHDHLGYEALAYLKLPGPDYLSVLSDLHRKLQPKLYVEIGVRAGHSLALAAPETKCIAIDPAPTVSAREWRHRDTTWAYCTSDRFFEREDMRGRARGFDLAFIDGDHDAEQAARDFWSLRSLSHDNSVIALHDVIPMDARTAQPKPMTSFWTGDVWRLMAAIVASARPQAFTVSCPPTGLGVVRGIVDVDDIEVVVVATNECQPLDMDWEKLARRLNIVPNDAQAIAAVLAAREG